MDLPEHRRAVYPQVKNRIDFKALGYPDDPARVGGRFYVPVWAAARRRDRGAGGTGRAGLSPPVTRQQPAPAG